MIIKGSRYSESAETRNGVTNSIATNTEFTSSSYYTVISDQGETFQSLASRYLNNPSMYWKLADVNKSLGYPDVIPMGSVIRIPLK
jgi:nucleoid-associated protein YgaU